MVRLFLGVLLISIFGSFVEASALEDLKLEECQSLETEHQSNSPANSHNDGDDCSTEHHHCHHNHGHTATLNIDEGHLVQMEIFELEFLQYLVSTPNNFKDRINRPPIS